MYLNGLLSWPTVPKSKITNEEAGSINVCYLSLEIRSRVSEHCHEVKRSIGLVVDQFSWLIDSLFGEKCWLALRDVLECFVSSKTRRKQKILTFKVLLPIKSIRIDSEHSVVSVLIVCSIDEPAPARRLHTEMLLCVTHSVQAVMSYSLIQK